jgi:hypothetical protein
MGYGGTSWGWLPAPVVFTSYDYGAAIAEDRSLRDKAAVEGDRRTIAAVPDLAGMVPAAAIKPSRMRSAFITIVIPKSDARFLLVAHQDGHLTENTSSPSPRTCPMAIISSRRCG